MTITFTRREAGYCKTMARREDGVVLQIPAYDRTGPLPHDLAHVVVERELGLTHGFWGCVAAGALFPGMTVAAGRQRPHAAARSKAIQRDAGQRGTEAEVLVGTLLEIAHGQIDACPEAAQARLAREWRPARDARAPLSSEEIRRVCQALRDVETRWQALAMGECLEMAWPATPRQQRRRVR